MKRIIALAMAAFSAISLGLPLSAFGEDATSYTISQLVVATGIQNREPVGVAEVFPAATEKLYCFLEAKDISADTQVTFVWYHAGKEVHRYSLPLNKGPVWRTWAECHLFGRAGEWKAEVQGTAGNSIKAVPFTVQ